MTTREVTQGLQKQGVDEEIAYKLTTTPWGASPTSVSAKVYSIAADGARTDTTSTNMSGTPGVSGDVITLPLLKSLVANTLYRIEVKFTSGGNVFEAYAYVKGEN
ncbi:MAG: hypothetical protein XU14_C0033G0017 [Armatimonadetes bacterium CSP1-3]|nr:MAG: hypothetical protein XU14_C0033G0017 [Armatimonadetes bacterium CSP1-3]